MNSTVPRVWYKIRIMLSASVVSKATVCLMNPNLWATLNGGLSLSLTKSIQIKNGVINAVREKQFVLRKSSSKMNPFVRAVINSQEICETNGMEQEKLDTSICRHFRGLVDWTSNASRKGRKQQWNHRNRRKTDELLRWCTNPARKAELKIPRRAWGRVIRIWLSYCAVKLNPPPVSEAMGIRR